MLLKVLVTGFVLVEVLRCDCACERERAGEHIHSPSERRQSSAAKQRCSAIERVEHRRAFDPTAYRSPSVVRVDRAYGKRKIRGPERAAGERAAHHTYWKISLRLRPEDDLATRAAAGAGVCRRTAFARLKRANKKLADFATERDPTHALERWLLASARTGGLPVERRMLIDSLVERGKGPGSAPVRTPHAWI